MRFRLAATLAVLALTTAAHAQSGITYAYTSIDPFSSSSVDLTGINDSGQIIGDYQDPASSNYNYYGFSGSVHSTGYTTLDPFGSTNILTDGINSDGQIVGMYLPPGAYTFSSFSGILSSNTYTTLPGFGNNITEALGLNDTGEIVGDYRIASNPQNPLGLVGTLGSTAYTAVDPFNSIYTLVNGVNNSGQIVGFYKDPNSTGGSFPGGDYYGYAGTLGGSTYTTIDPFGSLDTSDYGINNVGQIVGSYVPNSGSPFGSLTLGYVGALGSSDYTTVDPFGSGNVIVRGINDAGEIVGRYKDPHTGNFLGFEGTPMSPVPEASTTISLSLLLALGMGGVIIAKRKKAAPTA